MNAVSIVVEVGKPLAVLADTHDALGRTFAEGLAARIDATCRRLGIAPSPVADVRADAGDEAVRVRLNGRLRRCPPSVIQAVSEYFLHEEPAAPAVATGWLDELAGHIGGDDPERARAAAHALAAIGGRIVDEAPGELIGIEQVTRFRASAAAEGAPVAVAPDRLAGVLRTTVGLGVSVGDRPRVVRTIAEAVGRGLPDDDVAELVVSRSRSRRVRIEASPEYLERVADLVLEDPVAMHDPTVPAAMRDAFALMADGLFYELGVRIPAVQLAAAEDLTGCRVRVALGDGPPSSRVGLAPDHVFVSEPAEALTARGVAATPAINPADGRPCAIVATSDGARAHAGYTWDPVGYLVLLTASELRRQAHLLVDTDSVELELATLHQGFPALVMATLERIPVGHLARVMRLLLREEISIRNLRAILESLLAADLFDAVHRPGRVFDAENGAATARAELRHYVTHKHAREPGTLAAHLVDEKLQRTIQTLIDDEHGTAGVAENDLEARRERIRALVRAAVGRPGEPPAAILVPGAIRLGLQRLMADERPDLAVVAFEELAPSASVQPLGTIADPGGPRAPG